MRTIVGLTNDANQTMNLALEDGSLINFTLNYYANQQSWFFNLSYGSFSLNGARLVPSPNILRAWRNIIPFGLACSSIDGYEALYITDFTSGRISIATLNSTEVQDAETLITTTIPALAGIFRN